MMRFILFFFGGLLLIPAVQAQERVRNIRVRAIDSAQLEIRYDLISARPGDSVYFDIRSRVRGLLTIRPELVRGDVGRRIVAGSDRRIVWNALANGYALDEEIQAIVRVKAGVMPAAPEPTPEPVDPARTAPVATAPTPATPASPEPAPDQPRQRRNRDQPAPEPAPVVQTPAEPAGSETPAIPGGSRVGRQRYDGPAWALVSAVAPGIGNIFVQRPRPRVGFRPLVTVATYGLVAYGLMERQQAQDAYADYEVQKNAAAAEPFYVTANNHHQRYFMATRAAAAVALTDVVLTFIKGLRNSQLRREARRIDAVSVRPGLQMGQPTAVLRYSF
ncbi:hypothetical protein GGR92_004353 [Spirosoma lacussanchae]|uniref:hypothetical protein n=1 Tax=Spirosoma lacussanchae TaxID=1884249 RepID=UPI001FE5BBBC|nr:hypothetical protein [Spirosoma lacussanchae]